MSDATQMTEAERQRLLGELSILIVTWNGDALLADCLDSLARTCGGAPEIVVVDNAVTDACRAVVGRHANAVYVPSPGNPGFAGGNNVGLRRCTRRYVALLNNDTLVRDEPFSRLVAHLESHPEAGVVQGTLRLSLVGDVLDDCGVMLTPLGMQFHRLYSRPVSLAAAAGGAVFAGKGALLVFPRALVGSLGGVLFHDSFKSYYEETDFCHRAWLAGREVHFVPTPPVDHLCGQTSKKLNRHAVMAQYLSNILFSYATLLSAFGALRILPGFFALNCANLLKAVAGGDFGTVRCYARAARLTFARLREIRAVRKRVQSSRTISDRALFKRVLVRPPLRYYWLSAAGRLAEFDADV